MNNLTPLQKSSVNVIQSSLNNIDAELFAALIEELSEPKHDSDYTELIERATESEARESRILEAIFGEFPQDCFGDIIEKIRTIRKNAQGYDSLFTRVQESVFGEISPFCDEDDLIEGIKSLRAKANSIPHGYEECEAEDCTHLVMKGVAYEVKHESAGSLKYLSFDLAEKLFTVGYDMISPIGTPVKKVLDRQMGKGKG